MDLLSYQDTPVHRLDPRAKLITTIIYLLTVISFSRYEISMMIPFILYPVYLITIGNISTLYLLKKVLIASPFALMVGFFNPFFDQSIIITLGKFNITAGWISFLSIMLRFFLTVSTALAFIACTGFNNVCYALNRLGIPRIFSVQLLFLYRYIFVLAEEAARMIRARNLRSFDGKGNTLSVYGSLAGHLLLRTINRAERIHTAMISRGFDGKIRIMKEFRFGWRETVFLFCWSFIFLVFRFVNIPLFAGTFIIRIIS